MSAPSDRRAADAAGRAAYARPSAWRLSAKKRKRWSVAGWLDGAFGYIALAAPLCVLVGMSARSLAILLGGVLAIAVPAYVIRRRRAKRESREIDEAIARDRQSLGSTRLKWGKRQNGKLKHYEPNLMPLGLRKAVRTGNPFPEANLRRLSPIPEAKSK